jgi:hypothetical protein
MAITLTNPNSRPVVTAETSSATGVSVEIDYTTYYERIATALETLATNSTAIKNSIAAIETDIDTMATNSTAIKNSIAAIETDIDTMASNSTAMKNFAEHDGIHIKSPWEYLYMYSIINAYNEKGYNINTAKSEVESKPKHRD